MGIQTVATGASSGGGGGGGSCVDEIGPASGTSFPKNRIKFLCSYGGKILPRPNDGHLKYVGGETRVIAVPRDIDLSELMKKLTSDFEGEMVLKYQVIPEDLDVLVSVKNNEDLKHMLDEYDRHESEGIAKLRAFLFPSSPIIFESQNTPIDPHTIELRYIDAINNTVRSLANFKPHPIHPVHSAMSLSACTSPKTSSPEGSMGDGIPHEATLLNSYHSNRLPIHKVHSSPNLYNASNNTTQHQSNHYFNQQHPQYYQHHQQHYQHGYQSSSRPPHEPRRLTPTSSFTRPDFGRASALAPIIPVNLHYSNVQGMGSSNVHSNWGSNGHNMGSGNSSKGYYDNYPSSHPPSPGNKVLE